MARGLTRQPKERETDAVLFRSIGPWVGNTSPVSNFGRFISAIQEPEVFSQADSPAELPARNLTRFRKEKSGRRGDINTA
jgi:hypothetical protein